MRWPARSTPGFSPGWSRTRRADSTSSALAERVAALAAASTTTDATVADALAHAFAAAQPGDRVLAFGSFFVAAAALAFARARGLASA